MENKNISVYIQIPFCVSRRKGEASHIVVSDRETRNQYLRALENELLAAGDLLSNRQISSIYVGGGIASVVSPDTLARMLMRFKRSFHTAPDLELTIRAAPQTMVSACLSGLNMCGYTRLDLEVLTTSNKLLKQVGSSHLLSHIEDAYVMLDAFRVSNISSEILYGVPNQTWNSLRNALVCTSGMSAKQAHIHLVPYELAHEEGVSEEEMLEQYADAKAYLEENGLKEYGAGKFARAEKQCRFFVDESNSIERLGFGLGASSYVDGYFFQNTTDLKTYLMHSPDYTKLIAHTFQIDDATAQKRYAALRMQINEGFLCKDFADRFACEPPKMLHKAFEALLSQSLVEATEAGYTLSPLGKLNLYKVQQAILSA